MAITKIKRKFICVKPKTEEAQELFEYQMLGLQSCEIVEQTPTTFVLKPIKADFKFTMKSKNDPSWEIEK